MHYFYSNKLTLLSFCLSFLLFNTSCEEKDQGASDTISYRGETYNISSSILEDWGIEEIEGGLLIKDFDVLLTDLPIIRQDNTWNVDPNQVDSDRVYFVAYFDLRSIVSSDVSDLEDGIYVITGNPQLEDGKFCIDADFSTGKLIVNQTTNAFEWRPELEDEILSGEFKVEDRDNGYLITVSGTSDNNNPFNVSYDGNFDFSFVIDFGTASANRTKGKLFDTLR